MGGKCLQTDWTHRGPGLQGARRARLLEFTEPTTVSREDVVYRRTQGGNPSSPRAISGSRHWGTGLGAPVASELPGLSLAGEDDHGLTLPCPPHRTGVEAGSKEAQGRQGPSGRWAQRQAESDRGGTTGTGVADVLRTSGRGIRTQSQVLGSQEAHTIQGSKENVSRMLTQMD